jgi:hypothetical protein
MINLSPQNGNHKRQPQTAKRRKAGESVNMCAGE